MPTYQHGRHEHGQNFLTDRHAIDKVVSLVADTEGPIVEIGPGAGALTDRLITLRRGLTAVEIDRVLADELRDRLGQHAEIVTGDFLSFRLPTTPHVLVGNLPFHQTTAILRRILHAPAWTNAVLLVQWEVARRRAGVGGGTMMTAQWSPWFDFALESRVPARAFTPSPGVDGGLMTLRRQRDPQIPLQERRRFQDLVHRVYTGRGRGLAQILAAATTLTDLKQSTSWLRDHGLAATDLPRAMSTQAWIDLYRTSGASPPPRPRPRGDRNQRPRR